MAARRKRGAKPKEETLYTLTEVSEKTGISMPTLQRYKRSYQDRLPTVGEGRRQRYPEESLAVFEEIKSENIARRGRPRKNASADDSAKKATKAPRGSRAKARRERRKSAASQSKTKTSSKSAPKGNLLTLTEIKERTGISYPTLSRYVRQDPERFPSEGEGRRRRYYAAAIQAFQAAYEEGKSSRGRRSNKASSASAKPAPRAAASTAASTATSSSLKKQVADLEKRVKDLEKRLAKDLKVRLTIPGR